MPLTLVVEDGTGLSTANSYASVTEAETYHLSHLHATAWQEAGSGDKARALIWATRLLDQHADWKGEVASTGQALRWPRTGVSTPDGVEIDGDTVPSWLKHATAELARHLLAADRTAEPDTQGVHAVSVGPIALTVDRASQRPVIPQSVAAMIRPYARSIAGVRTGLVRLTRS